MCGIVAAISNSNTSAILMNGLLRLEYRGYDSAGIAFLNKGIHRVRKSGKVAALQAELEANPVDGHIGVAHTRWATHGVPDEANAHPHISSDRIVVVHNGIVENYQQLKEEQMKQGFVFESETDTEVIAHQIVLHLADTGDVLKAVAATCNDLKGAYALGVMDKESPSRFIAARNGSPLVIGLGENGNYISSDTQALIQTTQTFIYMKNGDIAEIKQNKVDLFDFNLSSITRSLVQVEEIVDVTELDGFEHYMLKEIYEQPRAVADTLEGRLFNETVPDEILGIAAEKMCWMRLKPCISLPAVPAIMLH